MPRYIILSAGLHLSVLLLIFWSVLFQRHVDVSMYYGVDFVGFAGSQAETVPAEKQEMKTESKISRIITAQKTTPDDLLVKTNRTKRESSVKRITERTETVPPAQNQLINPAGNKGSGAAGLPFGQGAHSAGGISVSNFPYNWYLAIIRDKVMLHWNEASSLSRKQVCTVLFIIERDGSLGDLNIERSSGDSYFDHVALQSVEYSQPFPPLPDDYKGKDLRVHMDFQVAK
ncbi:MAG: hypothetical protein A2297_09110 [Elusimicrobia bacterium RIFOXYB2_FULL_48_7]|nr:MAG: hypothetical protein A2297_09110 [Elusimicrobia bacterium RIFOXYB2_FULL_48_7]